jgi:predicted O-methyltransferase YrrM
VTAKLAERVQPVLRLLRRSSAPPASASDDLSVFGVPVRGWWNSGTIAPDLARYLVALMISRRPARIAECGPGISTVVLGLCARALGRGRVYSLEHDAFWARRIVSELAARQLEAFVEVRHAPLARRRRGPASYRWYDDGGWLAAQGPFELVLVDGPPGVRPWSPGRRGALFELFDALAPGGLLLLDDGARASERAAVAAWQRAFGDRITTEYVPLQKGLWVVRKAER